MVASDPFVLVLALPSRLRGLESASRVFRSSIDYLDTELSEQLIAHTARGSNILHFLSAPTSSAAFSEHSRLIALGLTVLIGQPTPLTRST